MTRSNTKNKDKKVILSLQLHVDAIAHVDEVLHNNKLFDYLKEKTANQKKKKNNVTLPVSGPIPMRQYL
jgi:hypothetical protein